MRLHLTRIDPDGWTTQRDLPVSSVREAESEFAAEVGSYSVGHAHHAVMYGPGEDGEETALRTWAKPAGLMLWTNDEGFRGLGLAWRAESPDCQRELFG